MIVIEQIQEALDQFNRGQKYLYYTITKTIKENQNNQTCLIQLLNELHDNVDLFENMNEQLLDFLQFQIDWTKQSKLVLDTFGAFQITLISSNTKHVQRYLSFLFTLFSLPVISIHDFAHETLQQLILIVPLASILLCPIVEQHFPFITKDETSQAIYISNLLRSLSYLPIERSSFLEIILSKLIRMDVASRQDILHAEQFNIDHELVFSLDTNETYEMKHDQADQLDCSMLLLFDYITNTSIKNEALDYDQAKLLFKDLLNVFNKILLPTHDSSHVQFLLFHICSFHTSFSDEFINNCWKIFVSPTVSITYRQAAICYLCSLIARAKYITTKSVLTITQLMVDWLHAYINATEINCGTFSPTRHLPFYGICQAVLYIFIYRHPEIIRLSDAITIVSRWRLGRIISSELNPLKFCLPAIALRFAQLARNYQIVFCYSIIEINNRYSLPEIFTASDFSNSHSPLLPSRILYTYFPFDPYVLKRSSVFIRRIYNEYRDENEDSYLTEGPNDHDGQDDSNYDDILKSMVMSTTPNSVDQMSFLSISMKNARNFPPILPFSCSPGFRHIV